MDDGFNGRYILNDADESIPEPDLMKWALWLEGGFRILERSYVDDVWISTVFLGLDHDYMGVEGNNPLTYRPLLWETMVFRGRESLECRRYRSKEEALAGHEALVEEFMIRTQP